ncbi:MAG: RnfABCDGE type electron transport complex subunit G [Kiritimatiellia bacterium]
MKELTKLIFVLTLVSLISGLLLAVTFQYTKEPIRQTEERQLFESLRQVLPPDVGDPEAVVFSNAAGVVTFYVVRKDGAFAGVAFSAVSPNGYAGPVEALIGLKPDGTIQGIEIKQNETPGLGSKITAPAFKGQFTGKPLAGAWKVRKDGGTIDAVSGATISSRALCDAVVRGQALYQEYQQALLEKAAAPAGLAQ